MTPDLPPFTGVVLAGGRGSRLRPDGAGPDSLDKPSVQVGGVPMLQRVVDALTGAEQVVVVGGPDAPAGTRRVVESPPGGGPVAGLAAALPGITTAVTVVLATDLPLIDAEVVSWLRTELARASVSSGTSAVLPVDADAHRQPFAAAYDTDDLRRAVAALGESVGRSMRDVCAGLAITELDPGTKWAKLLDVDTPEDLATARLHAWAAELTVALDVPLNSDAVPEVIRLVLDLARDAAHGIARPAAPVTTFLAGVAVGAALTSGEAGVEEMVHRVSDTVAVVLTRHEVG